MIASKRPQENDPSWRQFEKLVARIQGQLASNATVKWNDQLFGHISKTDRQVDVSIRAKVAQFEMMIVLSCKNYKRRVDAPHVEEFANTIKDVRANRGAMVASKGFTRAAMNVAEHYGIDLFTLLDASRQDWKSYLSLPIYYRNVELSKYSVGLHSTVPLPSDVVDDQLPAVVFYSKTGSRLGTALEIIADLWNSEEMPQEPGEHRVSLVEDGTMSIPGCSPFTPIRAFADVLVVEHLMFGYVPAEWAEGFRNEVTGAVSATKVEFNLKSPEGLERLLRPVGDTTEIAVAPLKVEGAEIGALVAESVTRYGKRPKEDKTTEARLRFTFSPKG